MDVWGNVSASEMQPIEVQLTDQRGQYMCVFYPKLGSRALPIAVLVTYI